jgi:glycosyltransferase involved in cell wall biosynthesis
MNEERSITICIDSPGWGGAEYDLGRLIDAGAFRPDRLVVSPYANQRLIALVEELNVAIIRHYCPNKIRGLGGGLLTGLKLKVNYPDSIWIFWCHHIDSNRWLQFSFSMLGMDYILAERICANSRNAFKNSKLSLTLKRFSANGSRAVAFCGYDQPALFQKIFNVKNGVAITIPNSRNISKIANDVACKYSETAALRKRMNLGTAPVFFCSGRLAPEKNFKIAILAFQLFLDGGGSGHLIIAGEGSERENLNKLISEKYRINIHLVGYQSDMIPWLGLATAFILPSYNEGVSGALIEAMAAGLPCIVSNIPGNNEIVKNNVTGLVFDADNVTELVKNIQTIIDEPKRASAMRDNAYNYVSLKYDVSVEVARWHDILRAVRRVEPVI